MILKHGKKPNRFQKNLICSKKLNPHNWLVVHNFNSELHMKHRTTNSYRVIKY
ncbi:DUF6906 family protein [Carnobacterium maltaromaticum]|uniref:DUF6906 family protein n=1 Tax=Carnobacterium maltaromaticum TaxID=2751 RepID=UPI0038FC50E3